MAARNRAILPRDTGCGRRSPSAKMGLTDIAGVTVVDGVGGFSNLAGTPMLKPRGGRHSIEGIPDVWTGHRIPLASVTAEPIGDSSVLVLDSHEHVRLTVAQGRHSMGGRLDGGAAQGIS